MSKAAEFLEPKFFQVFPSGMGGGGSNTGTNANPLRGGVTGY